MNNNFFFFLSFSFLLGMDHLGAVRVAVARRSSLFQTSLYLDFLVSCAFLE